MQAFRWVQRNWSSGSRPVVLGLGFVLLAIVGFLDWVTGPNLDFSLFYLIPVCTVTWQAGQRFGYLTSVASAAVWLCVDRWTGARSSTGLFVQSNLVMRLAFFCAVVLLIEVWKNVGIRLSQMVEQRTAALRGLAAQLSAAEDAQRRKLAYDMHDALSQTLSLIRINLDAAQLECPERTAIHSRLTDCGTMIDAVIKQTRTLMFDLYPAMLDDLGLVPTLQYYARELQQRVNTEIVVSELGPRRPLSTTATNYLFRALKELLNNAIRHGKAKEIILTVHWEASSLRLVVDDDGGGFDVNAAQSPENRRGLGLAGITERLSSMGGRIELESRPEQGSRIILDVPLGSAETSSEQDYAVTNTAG